jgi:hypothetical protein
VVANKHESISTNIQDFVAFMEGNDEKQKEPVGETESVPPSDTVILSDSELNRLSDTVILSDLEKWRLLDQKIADDFFTSLHLYSGLDVALKDPRLVGVANMGKHIKEYGTSILRDLILKKAFDETSDAESFRMKVAFYSELLIYINSEVSRVELTQCSFLRSFYKNKNFERENVRKYNTKESISDYVLRVRYPLIGLLFEKVSDLDILGGLDLKISGEDINAAYGFELVPSRNQAALRETYSFNLSTENMKNTLDKYHDLIISRAKSESTSGSVGEYMNYFRYMGYEPNWTVRPGIGSVLLPVSDGIEWKISTRELKWKMEHAGDYVREVYGPIIKQILSTNKLAKANIFQRFLSFGRGPGAKLEKTIQKKKKDKLNLKSKTAEQHYKNQLKHQ